MIHRVEPPVPHQDQEPENAADTGEILRAVRRIVRRVESHSRDMEELLGLSTAQYLLLEAIAHDEAQSQAELGERIDLAPSTMVGVTDRLVASGMVERVRVPGDRRRYHVKLTERGRALLLTSPRTLHHRFRDRVAALDPEERRVLQSALVKVVQMLEGEDFPASAILTSGSIPSKSAPQPPNAAPMAQPGGDDEVRDRPQQDPRDPRG